MKIIFETNSDITITVDNAQRLLITELTKLYDLVCCIYSAREREYIEEMDKDA